MTPRTCGRRPVLLAGLLLGLLAAALIGTSAASAAANFTWKAKGAVPQMGRIGSADAVACPSASLCVIGGANGVAVTTSIQANGKAWKYAKIAVTDSLGQAYITDVSCPVPGLCVAVDDHSNVYTSTSPAGGVGAWVQGQLPSGTYVGIRALSCATATLCGAIDVAGNGLTTVNPQSSWTATQIVPDLNSSLYEMSCVVSFCAAVQSDDRVYFTTAPEAQPATWQSVALGGRKSLATVACSSPRLCIAAEFFNSALLVSTNPTGSKAAWKKVAVKGMGAVAHLHCEPGNLCFALANTTVYWSTNPTKASSWKASSLPGSRVILSDLSCATPRRCVAIDVDGKVWVGTR
ncbi:MAG: hypothetical protein R3C15_00280 [Thermoleophilia bacterium]